MSRWFLVLAAVVGSCAANAPLVQEPVLPVHFRRTMCFGPCAAFTADFQADGSARLALVRGAAGTPLENMAPGSYRGTASPEAFESVARLATQAAYWELDASYDDPRIMDLPAVETTLRGHTVYNRHGGPDLKALYAALDSVVFGVNWTPDLAH